MGVSRILPGGDTGDKAGIRVSGRVLVSEDEVLGLL